MGMSLAMQAAGGYKPKQWFDDGAIEEKFRDRHIHTDSSCG